MKLSALIGLSMRLKTIAMIDVEWNYRVQYSFQFKNLINKAFLSINSNKNVSFTLMYFY